MKNLLIDGKGFLYETIEVKEQLAENGFLPHTSIHVKFDRNKVDEEFLVKRFDRQISNSNEYKFDIRYPLGTFYRCIITFFDIDKGFIMMDIKPDYNGSKPLKEHRNDIILDILSTSKEENNIKTNNNNKQI